MATVKRTRVSLYYEAPTIVPIESIPLSPSGSVLSDAGWTDEDTNPASGSLTWGSSSLFDGDYLTPVTPAVTTNWSIGIDLGHSGSIKSMTLFDSGSLAGFFHSGSNSTGNLYISYGPQYWSLWNTIIHPLREQHSGSVYKTRFELPVAMGCRRAKITAIDGAWKDPAGNIIRITEIEVEEGVDPDVVSGSTYQEYIDLPDDSVPAGTTETEVELGRYSFAE